MQKRRRKDFSLLADIHHEVLPWDFFCFLFFLSLFLAFIPNWLDRTAATGNCHALFSASNPWQSLKWDWQRRKKAIEMCPADVKAIQSSAGLCCPSSLPPKVYCDVCRVFFPQKFKTSFALLLADVTAQRFPDLKMSPGQLWILFVVTGKCLTLGPHKKVGGLKVGSICLEARNPNFFFTS